MRFLSFVAMAVAVFAAAPKPAPLNDAAIEATIRAKFAKSKISEEHFKVSVKIRGRADRRQNRRSPTQRCSDPSCKMGGARQVVNNIQVGEAARKKLADRLAKAREKRAAHRSSGEFQKRLAVTSASLTTGQGRGPHAGPRRCSRRSSPAEANANQALAPSETCHILSSECESPRFAAGDCRICRRVSCPRRNHRPPGVPARRAEQHGRH